MNVLLLCLSKFDTGRLNSNRPVIGQYSFNGDDSIYGFMTNEAPAKAIINDLNKKNERLDKIVAVCSASVEEKTYDLDSEDYAKFRNVINEMLEKERKHSRRTIQNDALPGDPFKEKEHELLSDFDIYRGMVNYHACITDKVYEEKEITYQVIHIKDNPTDNMVTKAVIEAANIVTETKEDIHFYVDYNGGQRYVAFMLLAIANLLKLRSATIKRILTMDFDPRALTHPIDDKEPLFESFDLIAGINEYVNYGRIKILDKYFEKANSEEIRQLLKEMKEFSNNLQLCRTNYVLYNQKHLWEHLKAYSQKEIQGTSDIYEQLFHYVVKDILNGYRGFLSQNIPQTIKWCIEHDFVQQALTFCSEELPGYLWDEEIFKATKTEEEGFERRRGRYYKKSPSKRAYDWMVKYLPHAVKGDDKQYDNRNYLNEHFELTLSSEAKTERDNTLERIRNQQFKYFRLGLVRNKLKGRDFENSLEKVPEDLWQSERKNQRVYSKIRDKKDLLAEILVVYELLKGQRHKTNHADDSKNVVWTYDQICAVLKELVKVLQSI